MTAKTVLYTLNKDVVSYMQEFCVYILDFEQTFKKKLQFDTWSLEIAYAFNDIHCIKYIWHVEVC